jgi:REP element-mobilizing transposase RayT
MARGLRRDLPDGIYHVTTRGVAETMVYRCDDDRRMFLALLAEVVGRYAWSMHALCLMGTHYHLVVDSTRALLSRGMQRLNGVYARRFNDTYDRSGHLWGDRFVSRVIEDERYLRRACHYVVANPVRAGLCADPTEWRWSGSRYGLAATAEPDIETR